MKLYICIRVLGLCPFWHFLVTLKIIIIIIVGSWITQQDVVTLCKITTLSRFIVNQNYWHFVLCFNLLALHIFIN